MKFRRLAQERLRRRGLEVRRVDAVPPQSMATHDRVKPYTMSSTERILACIRAAEYVVSNRIPGAFVECGVWAGGSAMAAADTFLRLRDLDRELFLYDTFEGMPAPSRVDQNFRGESAASLMSDEQTRDSVMCYASLDEVRQNMQRIGYPEDHVHLLQGKVEDTLPSRAPSEIALLRLDTDWYESTRHELEHLVPRMAPNGVLIIDDYGHWQGARKAVDEWLEQFDRPVLLNPIDYTGRIAVIPARSTVEL